MAHQWLVCDRCQLGGSSNGTTSQIPRQKRDTDQLFWGSCLGARIVTFSQLCYCSSGGGLIKVHSRVRRARRTGTSATRCCVQDTRRRPGRGFREPHGNLTILQPRFLAQMPCTTLHQRVPAGHPQPFPRIATLLRRASFTRAPSRSLSLFSLSCKRRRA